MRHDAHIDATFRYYQDHRSILWHHAREYRMDVHGGRVGQRVASNLMSKARRCTEMMRRCLNTTR